MYDAVELASRGERITFNSEERRCEAFARGRSRYWL
jgi:hypothetical protein